MINRTIPERGGLDIELTGIYNQQLDFIRSLMGYALSSNKTSFQMSASFNLQNETKDFLLIKPLWHCSETMFSTCKAKRISTRL